MLLNNGGLRYISENTTRKASRNFITLNIKFITMSDKCGNCDCSDKIQCLTKGNTLDIVQTENSYTETKMMEVAENNGNCNCGPNCNCANCSCGSH